jgi:hypothetical protein
LDDIQARIIKANQFLDAFVTTYCRKEIERQSDFFRGKAYDDERRSATVKLDRYNLVVAAAGSGKARTLTARVAYLARRGISPEKILALAYTNSAVEEMKERLKSEYGISRAHVSTFHSLARSLARLSKDFRIGVATESDQIRLIASPSVSGPVPEEFGSLVPKTNPSSDP